MGECSSTKDTATVASSSINLSLLTPTTNSFEYAEMNIRHTGNAEKTISLVKRTVRMGYDSVVVNIDIGNLFEDENDEEALEPPPPKKKKQKGRASEATPIPDPFLVDESSLSLTSLQSAGKRFRQYSRLTVTLSDTSFVHQFFHSPQLKKYDIIAIRAGNDQILTTLTRKTEFFDVLTYNQTATRINWLSLNKSKLIMQMAEEGIGFELSYADALNNSSSRRQVLANGRTLLSATKGKNVFISSCAIEMIDIRAPIDVMNMLCLFGVPSKKARPYLSGNARDVLLRAEAKKTLKGAVAVTRKEEIPTKTLSQQAAIARLLSVPEFFVQIEKVPPKDTTKKEEKEDVNMDSSEADAPLELFV